MVNHCVFGYLRTMGGAVPILPANFFEKLEAKNKEQNSGKIGENLEKWVSVNCDLAYRIVENFGGRKLWRIAI